MIAVDTQPCMLVVYLNTVDRHPCPLCEGESNPYWEDQHRVYVCCQRCDLVFVPAAWHLDAAAEKSEYDRHDNNIEDPGYRRFLSRMSRPVLNGLPPDSEGLDFGCGPGPALAAMFRECGHRVQLFDIYYYPDTSIFDRQYNFITATEVVEHLTNPAEELERLWRHLKPGGRLGLMTKRVTSREAFTQWHYKNDPTHISFFADKTFCWLADRWCCELEFTGADTVIFYK